MNKIYNNDKIPEKKDDPKMPATSPDKLACLTLTLQKMVHGRRNNKLISRVHKKSSLFKSTQNLRKSGSITFHNNSALARCNSINKAPIIGKSVYEQSD